MVDRDRCRLRPAWPNEPEVLDEARLSQAAARPSRPPDDGVPGRHQGRGGRGSGAAQQVERSAQAAGGGRSAVGDDRRPRGRGAAPDPRTRAARPVRRRVGRPDPVRPRAVRPPAREEAFHDGVPALMPAAQAEEDAVRYLLVEVDRSGADLTWSGTDTPAPEPDADHVEGGHDVLHKVRAGGWSHRRMQSRAEDSWERNAEAVAAELD